jgi:gamma-glutamyltranspeptidase
MTVFHSVRRKLAKASVFIVILMQSATANEPPLGALNPDEGKAHPFLAEGKSGMVVGLTGRQAVEAGVEVLKEGGTAVDAAMATATTQIVEAAGE